MGWPSDAVAQAYFDVDAKAVDAKRFPAVLKEKKRRQIWDHLASVVDSQPGLSSRRAEFDKIRVDLEALAGYLDTIFRLLLTVPSSHDGDGRYVPGGDLLTDSQIGELKQAVDAYLPAVKQLDPVIDDEKEAAVPLKRRALLHLLKLAIERRRVGPFSESAFESIHHHINCIQRRCCHIRELIQQEKSIRLQCVDLAIGVAASLELRMDLMDVVLELSRTWLAGDRLGERFYTSLARSVPKLRDLSLAERTECDATVMSVGEVSGPSAYARVADDVALAGAAPRDVRVAAAKAARKRVVAPRGAILDAARGAHAASVSWLKSHEREAAAAYSEDEDEDVGFATPRASAPGSPDWSPPSLAVFLSLGTSSRRMVVGDRDVALASPDAPRGRAAPDSLGAGSFGAGSFADFLLDDGSLMPCDDISLAPRVFLDTVAVTQSTQDETQEEADDDDDDDDARVHTPVAPPSDARRAAPPPKRVARVPARRVADGPRGRGRGRSVAAAPGSAIAGAPKKSRAAPPAPAAAAAAAPKKSRSRSRASASSTSRRSARSCRATSSSYKTGAAAADLKKMWDSFVRQLNYYGFHKRTRGTDEYAITDDPKITSPRKFSRLCRRLPAARAKDRPSISDLDRAALPAHAPPPSRAPRAPAPAPGRKRKAKRAAAEAIVNLFDGDGDYDLPGCDDDDADDEAPPSRLPPKKRKRRG
ncbi:hypothetical protein JL722_6418 [Aureococcus anophagefferens]|nr:hypothetical protein JL722_6418 [Aureococcus anophagefferens]